MTRRDGIVVGPVGEFGDSSSSESKSQRSSSVPSIRDLPTAEDFLGKFESGEGESLLITTGWCFLECKVGSWRDKKYPDPNESGRRSLSARNLWRFSLVCSNEIEKVWCLQETEKKWENCLERTGLGEGRMNIP